MKKKEFPDNYKRYMLMWNELCVSLRGAQLQLAKRVYAKYETVGVNIVAGDAMRLFKVSRAVLMDARKRGKLISRGKWGNQHIYKLDDLIAWAKIRVSKRRKHGV